MLANKLRREKVTAADLAAVQRQREFAVKLTQRVQQVIPDRIAAPNLRPDQPFRLPWFGRFMALVPGLRKIPANLLAFGPWRVRINAELLRSLAT